MAIYRCCSKHKKCIWKTLQQCLLAEIITRFLKITYRPRGQSDGAKFQRLTKGKLDLLLQNVGCTISRAQTMFRETISPSNHAHLSTVICVVRPATTYDWLLQRLFSMWEALGFSAHLIGNNWKWCWCSEKNKPKLIIVDKGCCGHSLLSSAYIEVWYPAITPLWSNMARM